MSRAKGVVLSLIEAVLPAGIFQWQISRNWHFSKASGIENSQIYLAFGIFSRKIIFNVWRSIFVGC